MSAREPSRWFWPTTSWKPPLTGLSWPCTLPIQHNAERTGTENRAKLDNRTFIGFCSKIYNVRNGFGGRRLGVKNTHMPGCWSTHMAFPASQHDMARGGTFYAPNGEMCSLNGSYGSNKYFSRIRYTCHSDYCTRNVPITSECVMKR